MTSYQCHLPPDVLLPQTAALCLSATLQHCETVAYPRYRCMWTYSITSGGHIIMGIVFVLNQLCGQVIQCLGIHRNYLSVKKKKETNRW